MTTDTTMIVQDPVDPHELFARACNAAGSTDFHEMRSGDMRMLQAAELQGALARISVHYPANGGPVRPGEGASDDDPPGYAHVRLTNTGSETGIILGKHLQVLRALAIWLETQNLRWAWRFENGPWHGGLLG